MKQYMCNVNITIGNGKGMHKFTTTRSYTQKFLEGCALTAGQIRKYFTADKGAKK